jgi:hypothetical protein
VKGIFPLLDGIITVVPLQPGVIIVVPFEWWWIYVVLVVEVGVMIIV